jgi:hypothetical protein
MIKPKHDMAYGQAVWDIYSCEMCGCLLLPSTAKLHEKFHNETPITKIPNEIKTIDKECPKCKKIITLLLDEDGAMVLDDYDDHMDFHEESER